MPCKSSAVVRVTMRVLNSDGREVHSAGGLRLCSLDPSICRSRRFEFREHAESLARLYRALATFSLTPVIYQLRVQAAPLVVQPGSVPEFRGAGHSVTRR